MYSNKLEWLHAILGESKVRMKAVDREIAAFKTHESQTTHEREYTKIPVRLLRENMAR